MSNTDCPFCTLDERILKQNEHAVAVLSNPRKTAGHFLVIPKRHVEKPWELKSDELNSIFELIFFIEQKVLDKLGDGCDIRQNYRPFMKQSQLKVDHMHFHVIPRSYEDYIYQVSEKYDTDLFTDLGEEERIAVEKLLQP